MRLPRLLPGVLLLAALALPACSPGGSSGPAKIVIWLQMEPEERARFEANVAAYEAAHPGVDIEYVAYDPENVRNQFMAAAAGGAGPHLVYGPSDQVGPFSLQRIIKPLDETLPAGYFDRFVPQALDTLDGHLWAVPDQVGNHLVLIYNKAMVPTPPADAAEFLAAARRNTRPARGGEQGTYGFVMNVTEPFWLVPFLAGYGGWVMDEARRPTLDSPAMVAALRFLARLKREEGIMPREVDYQVAETLFKEGKAAMIVNGPWSWGSYRKAGIDIGIAPLFRLPNGEPARPMTASKGYSINANVKDEELPAVIELVTFLTGPEATLRSAKELSILPSTKEGWANPDLQTDPIVVASQRAYELGRRMPVVPEMRALWDVMRPGLQEVMNGSRSPEQAAREMQAAAVRQIADMKR